MNTTLADGYNILPTPAAPTTPEPPATPRKPRTWGLFFCGIQWAVVSIIVIWCSDKHSNDFGVFQGAGIALALSLAIAALGLVWGVFQHVLKTIVRIVRHGN